MTMNQLKMITAIVIFMWMVPFPLNIICCFLFLFFFTKE